MTRQGRVFAPILAEVDSRADRADAQQTAGSAPSADNNLTATSVTNAIQAGTIIGGVHIYPPSDTADRRPRRPGRQPRSDVARASVAHVDRFLLTTVKSHTKDVTALAFSSNGRILATAGDDNQISNDGTVRLWDVADPVHPVSLGRPLTADTPFNVRSVLFSPDGCTLVVTGYDAHHLGAVWLWNIADPTRPAVVSSPIVSDRDASPSVAFSPDGRMLAVASLGEVTLWSVADPARPFPLGPTLPSDVEDRLNWLSFGPDGHTLAGGASRDKILLWSLDDPVRPVLSSRSELNGYRCFAFSGVFSADGRTLAIGGTDGVPKGMVWLWDVSDPSHPVPFGREITTQFTSVKWLAFSPEGRALATCSGGEVALWNLTDPNRPAPLCAPLISDGQTCYVEFVAFSPDGRTLAGGGSGGSFRLWDVGSMAAPATHPAPPQLPLPGS